MGAQVNIVDSVHIFIAIAAHKGLAAYALGSSVVDSQARPRACVDRVSGRRHVADMVYEGRRGALTMRFDTRLGGSLVPACVPRWLLAQAWLRPLVQG